MTELLQIAQLGHPVLRQKAAPVKNIADQKIQELIDDLIATVKDVDGVAPQPALPQSAENDADGSD